MNLRKPIVALAVLFFALPAAARQIRVMPGQSIQAAVDEAAPGDSVVVLPGTYQEAGQPCPTNSSNVCAVVVSKDNIRLIGASQPAAPVVLENAGGQDTGIAIAQQEAVGSQCLTDPSQRIHGALVQGFTVNNFGGNGIYLLCVDDWSVDSNTVAGNFGYGIFPSHCGPGEVKGNVASGAHDTGIYVGESHDVHVDRNVAHDNVSGFEVENSLNVLEDHNESFNNTAGILMFILPGLDVLASQGNRLLDNFIHDNNSPNTCPPGDEVCLVPPGVGILTLGGTHNLIAHNRVLGNVTAGIALVDVCTALQIPPSQCGSLGFDPLPEVTRIEFNTAVGNGTNPQESVFPGADLLWSGNGTGNCWAHNFAQVVIPPQLPTCH